MYTLHFGKPAHTSDCFNNMSLPVYLLLACVLVSHSVGVLGFSDGSSASSRIILPNSGTMLLSDAGGSAAIRMSALVFPGCSTGSQLLSWAEVGYGSFGPTAADAQRCPLDKISGPLDCPTPGPIR